MARSSGDRHMERIAGLLARAEDESNSAEERDAAARKAEQIGTKYSVDLAVAQLHTRQKNERDDQIVTREITAPHKTGEVRTSGYVALMLELVYASGIVAFWQGQTITVMGPKFDVEFTVTLFTHLVADQEAHVRDEDLRLRRDGIDAEDRRHRRESFRQAYRRRVRVRIEDLRDERMVQIDEQDNLDAGSTALALRDRAEELNARQDEELEQRHLNIIDDPDPFAVDDADEDMEIAGDMAGAQVSLIATAQIRQGKRSINQ